MIRKYYAEEKPLPAEVKAIQRLIGARTKEEKQAVEDILQEFFTLESDGWRNKRCDVEIERANAQADTNRRIAEEREARKRERILQEAETKRRVIDHDSLNGSLHDSSASREPSQTPDSRLQTPDLKATQSEVVDSPPAAASMPAENPTRKGDLCKRLRILGIDAAPHLQAWPGLLAGYSDEQILSVAEKARESKPGERIHLNYLVPILADTKAPQARGSPPHGKQALRADYLRQQGYTGGENGDSGGERIIDGQAERVA